MTAVVLFVSCAAPLRIEKMRVNSNEFVFKTSTRTATVTTKKDFRQKLFNAKDFNKTLIQSLEFSKLYSINPSGDDYTITAELTHWFQPPFGLDFHTDLRVKYTIYFHGKSIYEKDLESHSVAKFKESLSGPKRSKISMEKAVKQNIEMFLTDISKL